MNAIYSSANEILIEILSTHLAGDSRIYLIKMSVRSTRIRKKYKFSYENRITVF
jgi:hypothetical protein